MSWVSTAVIKYYNQNQAGEKGWFQLTVLRSYPITEKQELDVEQMLRP